VGRQVAKLGGPGEAWRRGWGGRGAATEGKRPHSSMQLAVSCVSSLRRSPVGIRRPIFRREFHVRGSRQFVLQTDSFDIGSSFPNLVIVFLDA